MSCAVPVVSEKDQRNTSPTPTSNTSEDKDKEHVLSIERGTDDTRTEHCESFHNRTTRLEALLEDSENNVNNKESQKAQNKKPVLSVQVILENTHGTTHRQKSSSAVLFDSSKGHSRESALSLEAVSENTCDLYNDRAAGVEVYMNPDCTIRDANHVNNEKQQYKCSVGQNETTSSSVGDTSSNSHRSCDESFNFGNRTPSVLIVRDSATEHAVKEFMRGMKIFQTMELTKSRNQSRKRNCVRKISNEEDQNESSSVLSLSKAKKKPKKRSAKSSPIESGRYAPRKERMKQTATKANINERLEIAEHCRKKKKTCSKQYGTNLKKDNLKIRSRSAGPYKEDKVSRTTNCTISGFFSDNDSSNTVNIKRISSKINQNKYEENEITQKRLGKKELWTETLNGKRVIAPTSDLGYGTRSKIQMRQVINKDEFLLAVDNVWSVKDEEPRRLNENSSALIVNYAKERHPIEIGPIKTKNPMLEHQEKIELSSSEYDHDMEDADCEIPQEVDALTKMHFAIIKEEQSFLSMNERFADQKDSCKANSFPIEAELTLCELVEDDKGKLLLLPKKIQDADSKEQKNKCEHPSGTQSESLTQMRQFAESTTQNKLSVSDIVTPETCRSPITIDEKIKNTEFEDESDEEKIELHSPVLSNCDIYVSSEVELSILNMTDSNKLVVDNKESLSASEYGQNGNKQHFPEECTDLEKDISRRKKIEWDETEDDFRPVSNSLANTSQTNLSTGCREKSDRKSTLSRSEAGDSLTQMRQFAEGTTRNKLSPISDIVTPKTCRSPITVGQNITDEEIKHIEFDDESDEVKIELQFTIQNNSGIDVPSEAEIPRSNIVDENKLVVNKKESLSASEFAHNGNNKISGECIDLQYDVNQTGKIQGEENEDFSTKTGEKSDGKSTSSRSEMEESVNVVSKTYEKKGRNREMIENHMVTTNDTCSASSSKNVDQEKILTLVADSMKLKTYLKSYEKRYSPGEKGKEVSRQKPTINQERIGCKFNQNLESLKSRNVFESAIEAQPNPNIVRVISDESEKNGSSTILTESQQCINEDSRSRGSNIEKHQFDESIQQKVPIPVLGTNDNGTEKIYSSSDDDESSSSKNDELKAIFDEIVALNKLTLKKLKILKVKTGLRTELGKPECQHPVVSNLTNQKEQIEKSRIEDQIVPVLVSIGPHNDENAVKTARIGGQSSLNQNNGSNDKNGTNLIGKDSLEAPHLNQVMHETIEEPKIHLKFGQVESQKDLDVITNNPIIPTQTEPVEKNAIEKLLESTTFNVCLRGKIMVEETKGDRASSVNVLGGTRAYNDENGDRKERSEKIMVRPSSTTEICENVLLNPNNATDDENSSDLIGVETMGALHKTTDLNKVIHETINSLELEEPDLHSEFGQDESQKNVGPNRSNKSKDLVKLDVITDNTIRPTHTEQVETTTIKNKLGITTPNVSFHENTSVKETKEEWNSVVCDFLPVEAFQEKKEQTLLPIQQQHIRNSQKKVQHTFSPIMPYVQVNETEPNNTNTENNGTDKLKTTGTQVGSQYADTQSPTSHGCKYCHKASSECSVVCGLDSKFMTNKEKNEQEKLIPIEKQATGEFLRKMKRKCFCSQLERSKNCKNKDFSTIHGNEALTDEHSLIERLDYSDTSSKETKIQGKKESLLPTTNLIEEKSLSSMLHDSFSAVEQETITFHKLIVNTFPAETPEGRDSKATQCSSDIKNNTTNELSEVDQRRSPGSHYLLNPNNEGDNEKNSDLIAEDTMKALVHETIDASIVKEPKVHLKFGQAESKNVLALNMRGEKRKDMVKQYVFTNDTIKPTQTAQLENNAINDTVDNTTYNVCWNENTRIEETEEDWASVLIVLEEADAQFIVKNRFPVIESYQENTAKTGGVLPIQEYQPLHIILGCQNIEENLGSSDTENHGIGKIMETGQRVPGRLENTCPPIMPEAQENETESGNTNMENNETGELADIGQTTGCALSKIPLEIPQVEYQYAVTQSLTSHGCKYCHKAGSECSVVCDLDSKFMTNRETIEQDKLIPIGNEQIGECLRKTKRKCLCSQLERSKNCKNKDLSPIQGNEALTDEHGIIERLEYTDTLSKGTKMKGKKESLFSTTNLIEEKISPFTLHDSFSAVEQETISFHKLILNKFPVETPEEKDSEAERCSFDMENNTTDEMSEVDQSGIPGSHHLVIPNNEAENNSSLIADETMEARIHQTIDASKVEEPKLHLKFGQAESQIFLGVNRRGEDCEDMVEHNVRTNNTVRPTETEEVEDNAIRDILDSTSSHVFSNENTRMKETKEDWVSIFNVREEENSQSILLDRLSVIESYRENTAKIALLPIHEDQSLHITLKDHVSGANRASSEIENHGTDVIIECDQRAPKTLSQQKCVDSGTEIIGEKSSNLILHDSVSVVKQHAENIYKLRDNTFSPEMPKGQGSEAKKGSSNIEYNTIDELNEVDQTSNNTEISSEAFHKLTQQEFDKITSNICNDASCKCSIVYDSNDKFTNEDSPEKEKCIQSENQLDDECFQKIKRKRRLSQLKISVNLENKEMSTNGDIDTKKDNNVIEKSRTGIKIERQSKEGISATTKIQVDEDFILYDNKGKLEDAIFLAIQNQQTADVHNIFFEEQGNGGKRSNLDIENNETDGLIGTEQSQTCDEVTFSKASHTLQKQIYQYTGTESLTSFFSSASTANDESHKVEKLMPQIENVNKIENKDISTTDSSEIGMTESNFIGGLKCQETPLSSKKTGIADRYEGLLYIEKENTDSTVNIAGLSATRFTSKTIEQRKEKKPPDISIIQAEIPEQTDESNNNKVNVTNMFSKETTRNECIAMMETENSEWKQLMENDLFLNDKLSEFQNEKNSQIWANLLSDTKLNDYKKDLNLKEVMKRVETMKSCDANGAETINVALRFNGGEQNNRKKINDQDISNPESAARCIPVSSLSLYKSFKQNFLRQQETGGSLHTTVLQTEVLGNNRTSKPEYSEINHCMDALNTKEEIKNEDRSSRRMKKQYSKCQKVIEGKSSLEDRLIEYLNERNNHHRENLIVGNFTRDKQPQKSEEPKILEILEDLQKLLQESDTNLPTDNHVRMVAGLKNTKDLISVEQLMSSDPDTKVSMKKSSRPSKLVQIKNDILAEPKNCKVCQTNNYLFQSTSENRSNNAHRNANKKGGPLISGIYSNKRNVTITVLEENSKPKRDRQAKNDEIERLYLKPDLCKNDTKESSSNKTCINANNIETHALIKEGKSLNSSESTIFKNNCPILKEHGMQYVKQQSLTSENDHNRSVGLTVKRKSSSLGASREERKLQSSSSLKKFKTNMRTRKNDKRTQQDSSPIIKGSFTKGHSIIIETCKPTSQAILYEHVRDSDPKLPIHYPDTRRKTSKKLKSESVGVEHSKCYSGGIKVFSPGAEVPSKKIGTKEGIQCIKTQRYTANLTELSNSSSRKNVSSKYFNKRPQKLKSIDSSKKPENTKDEMKKLELTSDLEVLTKGNRIKKDIPKCYCISCRYSSGEVRNRKGNNYSHHSKERNCICGYSLYKGISKRKSRAREQCILKERKSTSQRHKSKYYIPIQQKRCRRFVDAEHSECHRRKKPKLDSNINVKNQQQQQLRLKQSKKLKRKILTSNESTASESEQTTEIKKQKTCKLRHCCSSENLIGYKDGTKTSQKEHSKSCDHLDCQEKLTQKQLYIKFERLKCIRQKNEGELAPLNVCQRSTCVAEQGENKKGLDSPPSMMDYSLSIKSTDLKTDNKKPEMIKRRYRGASLFIERVELEEPKKPIKRTKRSLSCGACDLFEPEFPWRGRLRSSSAGRSTVSYKERDEDDLTDSPVDDKKEKVLKKIFGVKADPESRPRLPLSIVFDQDDPFFAEVVRKKQQQAVAQRDPRLRTKMPDKPVEYQDSVDNMKKRPVGRPSLKSGHVVPESSTTKTHSETTMPEKPLENENSVENVIKKRTVERPSLKSGHVVPESSTTMTHSETTMPEKPLENENSVEHIIKKRRVGRPPLKSRYIVPKCSTTTTTTPEFPSDTSKEYKKPENSPETLLNALFNEKVFHSSEDLLCALSSPPKKAAKESIRTPSSEPLFNPIENILTEKTGSPLYVSDFSKSCVAFDIENVSRFVDEVEHAASPKRGIALSHDGRVGYSSTETYFGQYKEAMSSDILAYLNLCPGKEGKPSTDTSSEMTGDGSSSSEIDHVPDITDEPGKYIGDNSSSSKFEECDTRKSGEEKSIFEESDMKKSEKKQNTFEDVGNSDTEDINEGKGCSDLQNTMEHFKKRLIHQCEEDTTAVDTNGKEVGPGEKKEIKIARKRPNCRSKFRHKDLEIYKLGNNTVSTSLCKTKEPYNVCKEKKLQEASETSNEIEKLNRPAIKGRHVLPAVINPIPERRKSRSMPTKKLEDGNNNTDLCNSLEDNCNPPENSSQPIEQPGDSTEKPENSVEIPSNTAPTIAVKENKTETLVEDVSPPVEQENPINLCVKKTKPENEVAKERPKTVNVPVTNKYPPPVQRNIPTKPSQKIVPMSTYPDTSVHASFPTNQMHGMQNQHTQGATKLQEDIFRSVVSLVKDRFLHPFNAHSLFILNDWYKYLNQYLSQDQSRSSFTMLVSVLRETEDFVMANLFLLGCGLTGLPISRLFVQEILTADLNRYKDLLNDLLNTQDRTKDWFKRFYNTLKACIQTSNSSRNGLPAVSVSNDANSLIGKSPQCMPNFKAIPVSQDHTIRMPQQPKQSSTGAQPNYCNVTSSNASIQRDMNIPQSYLQANATAAPPPPPQFNQRIYVPLNYEIPNTGNYSNGIPQRVPQEMSMPILNHSMLHGNRSDSLALKVQQEMHMSMMKQMSRFPHSVNQGIQVPMMGNAPRPVNGKNDVMQVHCSTANPVSISQQARQNTRVPLIDIPPPMHDMQVPANFFPMQSKRRRNSVHHDNNISRINLSEQPNPAPHQVGANRRIYPKPARVPVSSTSQHSMAALASLQQANPGSHVPMNTGLEQLRINEVPITRDPRCVQGMRPSKPGSMASQRMVQSISGSTVEGKYEVQGARGTDNARSDDPGLVIHLPETSQDVRVSMISNNEQSRQRSEQTNPDLLVPVLHIPEVSQDVHVPVNSLTDVLNRLGSNMRVPLVHGVNQEQRLPVNSGAQQSRLRAPQQAMYRLPIPVTTGIAHNAQIQHHDNAGGVRRNIRVPEKDSTATSTTFAGRSDAESSNKPCTVTSATITEPTKASASSSQRIGVAKKAEKYHKDYGPARPPNTSLTSENNVVGSSKQSQLPNTTSATAIGNVTKVTVPSATSINNPGIKASRKACAINNTSLQTDSDSISECDDSRWSHGSSTISAPIITQDIEEVIQTNVIVDPVKSIERSNLENTVTHIITANHLSTQLNKDLQITALKQNHSKRQMVQTENGSRSMKVIETNKAVEGKVKQNENKQNDSKDLSSSENELRLIKDVLRHQFKDTYPEIVRRVLLAKEEQGKLKNFDTESDFTEAAREKTVSVQSDSTSMSPKRQTEDELDATAKRIKSESCNKVNVKNKPDLSSSQTKTSKPSLPIIEDISSEEDTGTAAVATEYQKPDRQFRLMKPSENSLPVPNQALNHGRKAVSYPKMRQQLLTPNMLPPQMNCGRPPPAVPFSLPMTPESPSVPLPEVWQTWLDEERLRGNSFFTPFSGRRQSIETISSAGSDYSPRLNSDDVEIRIDSKWYRVKKHIYDRIPKGKLYYIQEKNIFIRYFDGNQMEQFYRSIGVKNANGLASDMKARVESSAETFLIPSDPSQVNEVIEVGKEIAFSTADQLREPEMYVEEIENVRRYVPKDFFGFYQFVTGYQIVRHNCPISFHMFLVLHNTNRIRKLLYDYVNALMQGQCIH